MIRFPRQALAAKMAQALQGEALFSDAPNGLFLAAPRRTGKTTFLRNDLLPLLEEQGVLVIYVDLWTDQSRDPAQLILTAVQEVMTQHRRGIEKLTDKLGLRKLGIGLWVELDNSPDNKEAASLPDALRLLGEASGNPVALIIDEAQQAVTTKAGNQLMMSLKSARDQLNTPDRIRLMLVMSGSDRDKLLRLVNRHAAPFYGSQIQQMPMLGQDFIEHIAQLIEHQQPDRAPVNVEALTEAFSLYGYRPQLFMDALGQALSPLAEDDAPFEDRLKAHALAQQQADEKQMASDYLGLPPAQQAVLWRMLEKGQDFRPYDADALAFYQQATGRTVTQRQVQQALEGLRKRTPPLAWKSSRGEYAVEDAAMIKWYRALADHGQWPPTADD